MVGYLCAMTLATSAALGGAGGALRYADGAIGGRVAYNSKSLGISSAKFGRGARSGIQGTANRGNVRVGWGWKGTRKKGVDMFRVTWSTPSKRRSSPRSTDQAAGTAIFDWLLAIGGRLGWSSTS